MSFYAVDGHRGQLPKQRRSAAGEGQRSTPNRYSAAEEARSHVRWFRDREETCWASTEAGALVDGVNGIRMVKSLVKYLLKFEVPELLSTLAKATVDDSDSLSVSRRRARPAARLPHASRYLLSFGSNRSLLGTAPAQPPTSGRPLSIRANPSQDGDAKPRIRTRA